MKLKEEIKENGFCDFIPKLIESNDHDSVDKTVSAMLQFTSVCQQQFAESTDTINILYDQYHRLATKELDNQEEDTFFRDILKQIDNLRSSIAGKDDVDYNKDSESKLYDKEDRDYTKIREDL